MKLMYGSTPVKSLNINYFERNTNDCDMIASDLQAGKTAVARGQKITGTGKSFEFAYYGIFQSNESLIIPIDTINVIHISSIDYPTQSLIHLNNMKDLDFTTNQVVCNLIVGGNEYPVTVTASNNEVSIACGANVSFEVFLGKDNYV